MARVVCSREEIRRLVEAGRLTRLQVYALEHQHPVNKLCHAVGIPIILVGAAWPIVTLVRDGWLDWRTWLVLQLVGWTFQGIGHRVEGNRPAFLTDPLQLLVGPVFFLREAAALLTGRGGVPLPTPPALEAPAEGAAPRA